MVLSPTPKKPEELGFYMPDSPFAKIAEEDGLDFNADKTFRKAELSAAQKANDVFDEHHVGRRWAEKLALMTRHTGAFRDLEGVKTPYGGVDEDGLDPVREEISHIRLPRAPLALTCSMPLSPLSGFPRASWPRPRRTPR